MDCKKALELMHAYFDNELAEGERVELEEHLKSCESCRREFLMQERIMENLKAFPVEELPAGFNESLHEKIATLKRKKGNRKKNFLAGILAASLLLMTMFLVYDFDVGLEKYKGSSSDIIQMAGTKSIEEKGIERKLPANVLRGITKIAYIDIEVNDLNKESEEIVKIVKEEGGSVESYTKEEGEVKFTFKVKEERFERIISELKNTGKFTKFQITTKEIEQPNNWATINLSIKKGKDFKPIVITILSLLGVIFGVYKGYIYFKRR
ncbi:zf-HC2 domain-containing protein [Caldanaerobacter sp.]|uniref:zf-HC2 domain-containing protein n=1 Tax=Caldanaerobacter sp. TaxID=2930036 RepID=UPI003C7842AC